MNQMDTCIIIGSVLTHTDSGNEVGVPPEHDVCKSASRSLIWDGSRFLGAFLMRESRVVAQEFKCMDPQLIKFGCDLQQNHTRCLD